MSIGDQAVPAIFDSDDRVTLWSASYNEISGHHGRGHDAPEGFSLQVQTGATPQFSSIFRAMRGDVVATCDDDFRVLPALTGDGRCIGLLSFAEGVSRTH